MDNHSGMSVIERGIWEHFTMQDGLPDMKIECLFEDSHGVLWIGTHDRGVVSYDGDEFKSYNRRDGLVGNGVFSILEDRDGNLWFGTDQGLCRFNSMGFCEIDLGEPYSFLWGNCIDNKDQLWFGLGGRVGCPPTLCRWDGRRIDLYPVSKIEEAMGESIYKITNDNTGRNWIGGDNFLYKQIGEYNYERIPPPSFHFNGIQDLLSWDNGKIWVAEQNGIWSYIDGEWDQIHQEDRYSPISLSKIQDGRCWMITYDGRLYMYDGIKFHLVHHLNAIVRGGICQDQIGRLWVGTYGMGLYCYDMTRMKVYGDQQGIPANGAECIAEDAEGILWIGTKKGLVNYDGTRFSSIFEEDRLVKKPISSLFIDHRNWLWIGTGNGLVFVSEYEKIKFCVILLSANLWSRNCT